MYSSETRKAREKATHIGATGHWVAPGQDWGGKPGVLLGHQGTWDLLTKADARELIQALTAIVVTLESSDVREQARLQGFTIKDTDGSYPYWLHDANGFSPVRGAFSSLAHISTWLSRNKKTTNTPSFEEMCRQLKTRFPQLSTDEGPTGEHCWRVRARPFAIEILGSGPTVEAAIISAWTKHIGKKT